VHLYIHVPFCARRCAYCDFAIAVRKEVPSEAYLDSVLVEWSMWQAEPAWNTSPGITSIYLGGGTPSRLASDVITRLLARISADRSIAGDAEITLEANPDDVTPATAQSWRAAGINRVSLGVQSFDPSVLAWMHRVHTVDQTYRAVEAIRCAGIPELSLDLIFGLPAALGRSWSDDLGRALSLEPEHLSLYGLTVEAHTALGHWTARGEVTPVDEAQYAGEFLSAHDALTRRGYDHYEVSNAGRAGHRARHNAAYWRRAPFIGLGPSAHSGLERVRQWNVREWSAYERLLRAGKSPREGRELLDETAIALEERYLGLRTRDGLPTAQVPELNAAQWQEQGWAVVEAERLRLTPEGWLRLDALVASLPGETPIR
jgi:oxygen-independent coproporphyrinogen III oxidase